jgi:hypothetical protein
MTTEGSQERDIATLKYDTLGLKKAEGLVARLSEAKFQTQEKASRNEKKIWPHTSWLQNVL